MVSNENFGLYLSVESIIFILCCAVLWWDCLEGSYIDRSNLLGQFLKNRGLWPICTICTSNKGKKHNEFNFDTKFTVCYNFFWKEENFQNFCFNFNKSFSSRKQASSSHFLLLLLLLLLFFNQNHLFFGWTSLDARTPDVHTNVARHLTPDSFWTPDAWTLNTL